MEFTAVAAALERTEPAVRQLAARARAHVRDARPRFQLSAEETDRITAAFATAMLSGDASALSSVLAADAVFYTDGGGKRKAALNPIYGRDKIIRFFAAGLRKGGAIDPATVQRAWISGLPGFLIHGADGIETLAIEIVDGTIVALYGVRNPDKLRHLS
jgi:RNA polymerase sigma-70 factor (ECF subfamily)